LFGAITVLGVETAKLEAVVSKLQQQDYFRLLGVRRSSTDDELIEALETRLEEYGGLEQGADSPSVRKARKEISTHLEDAHAVLSDAVEKNIYSRALQLGLDFSQPDVRKKLRHEYLVARGKSLLASEEYDEATEVLLDAVKLAPEDPVTHIHLGWSQFLGSEKSADDAITGIARVEQALKLTPSSDLAYLTIGKIQSLSGDLAGAKKNLGRATELNGDNHEAWAQLRLLNQRKVGPEIQFKMELKQGLGPTLIMAIAALLILYAGANVIGGGAAEWPDIASAKQTGKTGDAEYQMALAVRERLQGEVDYRVPEAKRVMGNVEYYYLMDDTWFWMRRAILLLFALIGLFAINREKGSTISVLGKNSSWVLMGIPYGLIIGFLSAPPQTPTEFGPLMAMTTFHVLAEQLFFFAFVGRSLIKALPDPVPAVAMTAVIFGLHQLTFFATLQSPTQMMLTGTLQVAAFGGGAYAILLWRSGGLLAPMLAQLVVHATMMTRAVLVTMA
jgi:tetratricopeptide (TPR) repeat protein